MVILPPPPKLKGGRIKPTNAPTDATYIDDSEMKAPRSNERWMRNIVKCTECSATFRDNKKLLLHVRSVHKARIEHFCQVIYFFVLA